MASRYPTEDKPATAVTWLMNQFGYFNAQLTQETRNVPEHFFEKKQLVPALQQLLASYSKP